MYDLQSYNITANVVSFVHTVGIISSCLCCKVDDVHGHLHILFLWLSSISTRARRFRLVRIKFKRNGFPSERNYNPNPNLNLIPWELTSLMNFIILMEHEWLSFRRDFVMPFFSGCRSSFWQVYSQDFICGVPSPQNVDFKKWKCYTWAHFHKMCNKVPALCTYR